MKVELLFHSPIWIAILTLRVERGELDRMDSFLVHAAGLFPLKNIFYPLPKYSTDYRVEIGPEDGKILREAIIKGKLDFLKHIFYSFRVLNLKLRDFLFVREKLSGYFSDIHLNFGNLKEVIGEKPLIKAILNEDILKDYFIPQDTGVEFIMTVNGYELKELFNKHHLKNFKPYMQLLKLIWEELPISHKNGLFFDLKSKFEF